MDIKTSDPRLVHEYSQGWVLSVKVAAESVGTAKRIVDELSQKEIRISARQWKEHRSLSANAYFHVLIGKIAKAVNVSEDEVKREMVLSYGTQARDGDGEPIWINLPENVKPESFGVKYAKWFNDTEVRGKTHRCFIVFQETHLYDTKQFSRLLDGTIHEAKQLGIETITPAELKRMMEAYASENKGTQDSEGSERKSA